MQWGPRCTPSCTELGITVKKTRPYRPQTNGKLALITRVNNLAGHHS